MRTTKLLFIIVFLNSSTLLSNQLTSLEQLISPNAQQNFGQYFNVLGRRKTPLVLQLITDIYRENLPLYEKLKARRLLDEVLASLKSNVLILEMQRLLTARHLELLKEQAELPDGSLSGLSIEEIRKILDRKEGFDLCD